MADGWWAKILCLNFLTKEIQEQFFDEKTNTVTIKVVCCSPERPGTSYAGKVMVQSRLLKSWNLIKSLTLDHHNWMGITKNRHNRMGIKKTRHNRMGITKNHHNRMGIKKNPPQPDGENPKPPLPPLVPVPCYTSVRVCCKQSSEGHGWGPCHQLGLGQERHCDLCKTSV
ncbi:hypothetical protein WN944_009378 [Citrus x changshan-huyou]|uniref:Uncharacterized protein n=1 Tax=Citrus x changshan-huyou TaxID=2935761 RepID=A0AAP0MSX2_9ROSI